MARARVFQGAVHAFVLLQLVAAAASLRWPHANVAPLDFHPTRQYHSALIARGAYYAQLDAVPAQLEAVATENGRARGTIEPPIMEELTVLGYRTVGAEPWWVPRGLAAVFWIVGGLLLFGVGARVGAAAGGLTAAAFYLLAPFGVVASTSFQPDPLMVASTCLALLFIVRDRQRPTAAAFLVAAGCSAWAGFVKPVALLLTISAFTALAWGRDEPPGGLRLPTRFSRSARCAIFAGLSLAPFAAFYVYGTYVTGALAGQTADRFYPHLLVTRQFWGGWWALAVKAVGSPWLVAAALAGTLLARRTQARLLVGLWVGYALLCVTFAYHASSHDYYHLPLIPIAALGIGALVDRLCRSLPGGAKRWPEAVIVAAAVVVLIAVVARGVQPLPEGARIERQVRMYERIGALLGSDARSIALGPDYSFPLQYHGNVRTVAWPAGADVTKDIMSGRPVVEPAERYRRDYEPGGARYFVVTDFEFLDEQPGLRAFLDGHFSQAWSEAQFLIYDLQSPAPAAQPREAR